MVAAGADVLSARVDTGLEIPNEPPVRPEIFIYTVYPGPKGHGSVEKEDWLQLAPQRITPNQFNDSCGVVQHVSVIVYSSAAAM